MLFNFGTPAFALLIGNLKVSSYMGEPLRVLVAVSSDDDSLSADCFRLAGPSSHRLPFDRARLELETIDGKKYLSIITRDPVSDPILDMTLRTEGCGATFQKDYVVLLSPKGVDVETAPAVQAPANVPATPEVTPPIQAASRPKPRSASAGHRHPTRKHYVAPANTRQKQVSAKRLEHFALHLDYDFGSLAKYADQIARQKQQNQNSALTQAPAVPAKPLSGAEDHKGLSAQPAGTDRLVLQPAGEVPQGQPGANESAAGNAALPESSPGTAVTPGNGQSSGTQSGIAGSLPTHKAQTPTKSWSQWLLSSLLLLGLVLLLVLLVALWLKRRTPTSRFFDQSVDDMDTLMPANPEYPMSPSSRTLPPVDQVFVEPNEAKTLLAESYMPEKEKGPATLTNPMVGLQISPNVSDFTVEQFDSTEHVLELAEVMLAFGRSNQAIETLSQYIRNNPNQAVEPWLKLLDLYVKSDLRDEFEALATDLHKNFNVVIADWKDFEPAKGLSLVAQTLTLESLPHIAERLTSTWGTPECLQYLDKLLADNRSGQRHGFSLPLVRDILLLRDILRDILRPTGQIPAAIH